MTYRKYRPVLGGTGTDFRERRKKTAGLPEECWEGYPALFMREYIAQGYLWSEKKGHAGSSQSVLDFFLERDNYF